MSVKAANERRRKEMTRAALYGRDFVIAESQVKRISDPEGKRLRRDQRRKEYLEETGRPVETSCFPQAT